jgi:hypothetical protein
MPDRTKFIFNRQEYGKGRLVLEVVRKYVAQHPEARYEDVRQTFPDGLQKTESQFSTDGRCVIRRRKDVTDQKRYHMKKEDQIEVMGEAVVVSREWNVLNIQAFIDRARQLGFEIEKVVKGR